MVVMFSEGQARGLLAFTLALGAVHPRLLQAPRPPGTHNPRLCDPLPPATPAGGRSDLAVSCRTRSVSVRRCPPPSRRPRRLKVKRYPPPSRATPAPLLTPLSPARGE